MWGIAVAIVLCCVHIGTRQQALEEEQRIIDACESSDEEVCDVYV